MRQQGSGFSVGVKRHMRPMVLGGMVLLCAAASPAQNLWDLFSNRYTTNVLAWTRYNGNPVIGPSGSTWKSHGVGGPELLTFGTHVLMFYHGTGGLGSAPENVDRIGVAEVSDVGAERLVHREMNGGLPVIDVGAAGTFDHLGASTPAAVFYKGQIYLYYTGKADSGSSIGLAVSANGEQFIKIGRVMGGICPDVVAIGDTLYMIYQRLEGKGYKVHLAFSTDGRKFLEIGNGPVFEGKPGDWDAVSITAPRLWKNSGWIYMMYGGSAGDLDEPEFFGLARSKDLVHWERHPGNPVFGAGVHGGPDGGTIRSPALFENDTWVIMIYEGNVGHHFWAPQASLCMAWVLKR